MQRVAPLVALLLALERERDTSSFSAPAVEWLAWLARDQDFGRVRFRCANCEVDVELVALPDHVAPLAPANAYHAAVGRRESDGAFVAVPCGPVEQYTVDTAA